MKLKLNGQQVTQTFASGGSLRIDPPRQQVAEAKPAAVTPKAAPKSGK
jgi:hypothetical protein